MPFTLPKSEFNSKGLAFCVNHVPHFLICHIQAFLCFVVIVRKASSFRSTLTLTSHQNAYLCRVCFPCLRCLVFASFGGTLGGFASTGSCNGLQHYAALGLDAKGGAQVNLVPADKPGDVYTGVCNIVKQKVRLCHKPSTSSGSFSMCCTE